MSQFSFNLSDIVEGIFKPLMETVDDVHTSQEERLEKKAELLEQWSNILDRALDMQSETMAHQAKIIEAEARSDHWLAAVWRPIVMLLFAAMATLDALGLLPNPLAPDMWTLLQIGLGGYVVGRSGEKITRTIVNKATQ